MSDTLKNVPRKGMMSGEHREAMDLCDQGRRDKSPQGLEKLAKALALESAAACATEEGCERWVLFRSAAWIALDVALRSVGDERRAAHSEAIRLAASGLAVGHVDAMYRNELLEVIREAWRRMDADDQEAKRGPRDGSIS